jgi:hypothetical protein
VVSLSKKDLGSTVFEKFPTMMRQFEGTLEHVSFSDFLSYYQRANENEELNTTINKLKYSSKKLSLLHQLVEDGKLLFLKDILNKCSKSSKISKQPFLDIN